jgi:hypothetical protein
MALALSDVSFGARSVAFKAVNIAGAADTTTFADVAAIMLAAQPNLAVSPTPIYSFLTTSHTNQATTVTALAQNGAILASIPSANVTTHISGDNTISVSGNATVAIRIAFAASISA